MPPRKPLASAALLALSVNSDGPVGVRAKLLPIAGAFHSLGREEFSRMLERFLTT